MAKSFCRSARIPYDTLPNMRDQQRNGFRSRRFIRYCFGAA